MKALITGASSGIGRDIARELSKNGYDLILVARDIDKLNELQSELKTNSDVVCMDVSKAENCKELHNKYNDIDILVNNAGFGDCGYFDKTDIEKELQNKISLCNLKIAHMKTSLLEIEEVLKEDKAFYSYIDTMKLEVQQDGVIIPVNRNTIRNAKSNLEFLKARRAILLTGIEKLNREKSSLQDKLQDYLEKNTPITSLMGSSADIIINKQLATVSVDQTVVEGLLEEVTNRLKEVNKLLKFKIKNNNPYIDDIYNYVLNDSTRRLYI